MTEPPVGLAGDALLRYWDIRDAHDSLAGQVGHEDIEPGQVLHNDVIALAAQQPFYAHSGGQLSLTRFRRRPWPSASSPRDIHSAKATSGRRGYTP